MKQKSVKRIMNLLVGLALVVVTWYLNEGELPAAQPAAPQQGEAKKSEPRSWPTPTQAELDKLTAEKGMKISQTALKKLKSAVVERVVDGDTVELKLGGKNEKVRLLNVDTPETVAPGRPVEEYGREASNFTKSILKAGTKVYVKSDVEERDRYDRLLLHLYLEDGTWVNALLIRAGYAQLLTVSPNVDAAAYFKELQTKARSEEIGLWQIQEYRNPPKK